MSFKEILVNLTQGMIFFLSEGPDNIPDATETIQQVITPGKDERTFLEGKDFRLEMRTPVAVVRQILPLTPHKQLAVASSVQSENTDTDGGKKRSGLNIDDDIKLAFFEAWIQWSEVPFAHRLSEHKSKKVKNSIENILE